MALNLSNHAKPPVASAEKAAASESQSKVFIFATRNVPNYRLGPWQFEKGQLRIESEEEAIRFRDCLAKQPPVDRALVTEIDLAAAEALVAAQKPVAQRGGTDSAELRAAMDAAKQANGQAGL